MKAEDLNGLVLAAGPGRRLGHLTETIPKTLLPVKDDLTILDFILRNFREVGIRDVAIVTGFASDQIEAHLPRFEEMYELRLQIIFNDRASDWNNAYSLWCARHVFAAGALLANGDTLHPASFQRRILDAPETGVILALDDTRAPDEEAMKVRLRGDGTVSRIAKQIDSATSAGEYIGVTRIDPGVASALAVALEETWTADPTLYYEDAIQRLADGEIDVHAEPVGSEPWTEVDDEADLDIARGIALRY